MEEQQTDIYEELISKVVAEANMEKLSVSCSNEKKNNPFLVANEMVKTDRELKLKEAEILQKDRDQDQKDREMDQKDRDQELKKEEIKNERIKIITTAGVTLASLVVGTKIFVATAKSEIEGFTITSKVARAILNSIKIFK